MKILVVGSGGREHALAWKLAQSPDVSEVIACPGNPGIETFGKCVASPGSLDALADLTAHLDVAYTVVGPEAPLVEGIVDLFRARGLKVVGPTRAAAHLEGSKVFAKRFFERAGIPTARSVQVETQSEAEAQINDFSFPVVLKADGLAAGKGVIIAFTLGEATHAIRKLGTPLVIEEFLTGEEVSLIGLSDGKTLLPFAPAKDHKKLLNNDEGPNTGGMGAYAGSGILTNAELGRIMDEIMMPTLRQMERDGAAFTGFLYAGLMMTSEGPKVLEFNARLGDPETQALLYGLEAPLAQILHETANGTNPGADLSRSKPSACVVMASEGYPERPTPGALITGIEHAEESGAKVFQAGTRRTDRGLETAGGRVLGVTATGANLQAAIRNAYRGVAYIQFDGMQFRTDIGKRLPDLAFRIE
ncbi:MAG: phosphoribosylamine--glycine ligase [Bryobacteraceae bacterium]